MVRVVVTEPDGRVRELRVAPGASIQEVARQHDLALECTCGGQMACATCHVAIDPAWVDRLPPPSAEEREMLTLAVRPRRSSRLGCQVRLTPELDGLAFTVIGE